MTHLLKWKFGWLPARDRIALVGSPTGSADLRLEATLQALGTRGLRPWPRRTLNSSQMDLFLIRCGKFLNLGSGVTFAPLRKKKKKKEQGGQEVPIDSKGEPAVGILQRTD